jgi:2-Cys peroxiredoxin 5
MSPASAPAALRLAAQAARRPAAAASRRAFHATARSKVAVGSRLPDVDLMETSPGNKVNLARELAHGKALIVGVPAAFSSFPRKVWNRS